MVLMQPNMTQQQNSCGTVAKCSGCIYRLICPISPYCSIKNVSQSSNFDAVSMQKGIDSQFESLNSGLVNMDFGIKDIVNSINNINSRLEDIYSKLDKINTQEPVNYNYVEETQDGENNGLVPYSKENQTVLVEKKGLFGKSKWVEEKIK